MMANKKRQLMQFTEVLRISAYTLAKKSCALFCFLFFALRNMELSLLILYKLLISFRVQRFSPVIRMQILERI